MRRFQISFYIIIFFILSFPQSSPIFTSHQSHTLKPLSKWNQEIISSSHTARINIQLPINLQNSVNIQIKESMQDTYRNFGIKGWLLSGTLNSIDKGDVIR
uniref:Uncharacterized protein n=1 Tax=Caenorhabditis japonica TaxID=281687 RepID=A0A8R1EGD5_CAEJA